MDVTRKRANAVSESGGAKSNGGEASKEAGESEVVAKKTKEQEAMFDKKVADKKQQTGEEAASVAKDKQADA